MIHLYSGTPGSGKSVHLARDIYDWVKYHNGVVIGNFEIDTTKIKGRKRGMYLYCDNSRLTPERIFNFCLKYNKKYYSGKKRVEGRYILIIDEAQLLFNAREWQETSRKRWLSFFTQHRKVLLDIYLVAQMDRMLDRNIRGVVEYETVHRKVSNYGLFGAFLGLFCGGNLFCCVKRWYPLKLKVGQDFFIGRKKFFSLYDTDNLFIPSV